MSGEAEALAVRCTYCGVGPGERCRIMSPLATVGRAVYGPGQFHAARVRAAEKARREKEENRG